MKEQKKLTILIGKRDSWEQMEKTCTSIVNTLHSKHHMIDVWMLTAETEASKKMCELLNRKCNASIVPTDGHTAVEQFQCKKGEIEDGYVCFLEAGDIIKEGGLQEIRRTIKAQQQFISFEIPICNNINEKKQVAIAIAIEKIIFTTDWVREHDFNTEIQYDAEIIYGWQAYSYIYDHYQVMRLKKPIICIPNEYDADNINGFVHANEKAWYTETLAKGYLPLVPQDGELSISMQYLLLWAIKARYLHNRELKNKQVVHEAEDYDAFVRVVSEILKGISDHIIMNANVGRKVFTISNELVDIYMHLKHDDLKPIIAVDKNANGNIHARIGYYDTAFFFLNSTPITIDMMDYEDDHLVIDLSYLFCVKDVGHKLSAYINDRKLELLQVERFGQIEYFGRTFWEKENYRISIPRENVENENLTIRFVCELDEKQNPLRIATGRFTARLTTKMKSNYWVFNDNKNMIQILNAGSPKARLQISKIDKKEHRKCEKQFLKELYKKDKHLFLFRCLYWLGQVFYHPKNILITFDKMYKGGDNGEYLYKYAKKQQDDIHAYYLATKGYADTKRLKKEGMRPLIFATLREKYLFLCSDVIAATHANMPIFSGFTHARFAFVQDLFHAKVVCIQHGLTVQQIPDKQNRMYDNTKRYYLASPIEEHNLTQSKYGYDGDYLRMTGLARYDGLVDREQKQILLIPTWRSYLAMPSTTGQVRPYSPTFKDTEYFRVFDSLLHNEKLLSTARKYGYSLLYVLHPTIAQQADDFVTDDDVKVVSSIGLNYEKVFCESSLMITDFSGVQFDFAYMRKPILYYHPDELPAHYDSREFDYVTQGFGEICKKEEELVDMLCEYIENDCKVKELFEERQNSFFTYSDHDNCKRIYDDILKLIKK